MSEEELLFKQYNISGYTSDKKEEKTGKNKHPFFSHLKPRRASFILK